MLTAIGYPAAVDNGADTKLSKTVPSVTQGSLSYVSSVAGGHKVFMMTTRIASGNSGGPTIDASGKQVGLNTYSSVSRNCGSGSDISDCFGRGVARDIEDLKAMASNVALIANVLILPLVPLAMLLTFVVGVCADVPVVAGLVAAPTTWLLQYMVGVAQWLAGLDWAQLEVSLSWLWVIITYLIIIGAI